MPPNSSLLTLKNKKQYFFLPHSNRLLEKNLFAMWYDNVIGRIKYCQPFPRVHKSCTERFIYNKFQNEVNYLKLTYPN